jgi:hypothetical protein
MVVLDSKGGGIVLRHDVKRQFCAVVFGVWASVFGLARVDARPEVKISVASSGELKIRVKSLSPGSEWSFPNAYAGVLGIAERVEEFQAFGPGGENLGGKKIATGEFRSEPGATSIDYKVKLRPPGAADVSHVSWISGEHGLLMLADLLPERLPGAMVEISLPPDWAFRTAATSPPDSLGRYYVAQPEKAVFLVGRSLRTQLDLAGNAIGCFVAGNWPFKDEVLLKAATKVLKKYIDLTGFSFRVRPVVMLVPLPVATGNVKWRAETRGSTVVLLMDAQAAVKNWSAQLGIIFTHELLHLWVPNALHLEGDYDWFFEGFTLYTALVTALELKFINFNEYLSTLARVYDSYLSRPDPLSLIDASERRWTSGSAAVYDKGMLVAFLYDLAIKRESGGKSRLAALYQQLFQRREAQPANGNEVIIQLLSTTAAGADLARRYIKGSQELDLNQLLADRKQLSKSLGYH